MKDVISVSELDVGGFNAPRHLVDDVNDFWPVSEAGASQYRFDYGNEAFLDALLVNKQSNILVVTFHGALDRKKIELPRYERLKTKAALDISSMYFSDPSLWLDEDLQLGWYTGWKEADVIGHCAHWIVRTAQKLEISKIIISGSSGGGFAALQVSARIPGSVALPFNPQTELQDYYILNKPENYGPVKKYLEVVHPECVPDGVQKITHETPWSHSLGTEVSAVKTYSEPIDNFVMYCHSPNDWLHDRHYVPFILGAAHGDNLQYFRIYEYIDKVGHFPPQLDEFVKALQCAIEWKIPLS